MSPLCIASVVLLMGFPCLGWPPNCWTCVYFAFHRVNTVKRKQFAKEAARTAAQIKDLQKQGSSWAQFEHAFHIRSTHEWMNTETQTITGSYWYLKYTHTHTHTGTQTHTYIQLVKHMVHYVHAVHTVVPSGFLPTDHPRGRATSIDCHHLLIRLGVDVTGLPFVSGSPTVCH